MFGGKGIRAGTHSERKRNRFARLRLPSPDLWVWFFACHVALMDDLQSVNTVYMHQTKRTGMQRD